jgi:hypothetical protein
MQKRVFGGVKETQADGHPVKCNLASESGVENTTVGGPTILRCPNSTFTI